jgi:hypothetical protein
MDLADVPIIFKPGTQPPKSKIDKQHQDKERSR